MHHRKLDAKIDSIEAFFRVFMVASAACWWASRLEYPEPEPTTVPLIADALAGRWVSACR